MTKKTCIAQEIIIQRMSDIEYIKYLENCICNIDKKVNQFITLMDAAIFSKGITDKPMEVLQIYADNVQLLQGLN